MVNSQLTVATSSEPTILTAPIPAEIQSIEDLITKKALASGVDPILANKIAFCESTMRQFDTTGQVLRGIENSKDVGLFQINEGYHIQESQNAGYDIYTTEGNIDYAIELIKESGVRHWKASQKCWDQA